MKIRFTLLLSTIAFMGMTTSAVIAQEEELPSLGDALKQSGGTVEYLGLAMDYSLGSIKTMLELTGDEQSEQRKKLAASVAEIEKNRETANLDAKTIDGINESGAALKELKFESQADKEKTKKLVRKAYLYSSMVLAMDVTAALAVTKDLDLLTKVIKKNSGLKALKDKTIRGQVAVAKDQASTMSQFSKTLPAQKDNFIFVRQSCKQIAADQNFTLGDDINPEDVATKEAAISKVESEEID